ncbi:hypothetical protein [Methylobacterium sp. WL9]|nr:hypothetical protein [Methylobacterium sp. WL9]
MISSVFCLNFVETPGAALKPAGGCRILPAAGTACTAFKFQRPSKAFG